MPKRPSIKEAATAGTAVIEQITRGNTENVQDVQDVQDARHAQKKPKKEEKPGKVELVRLNLKIPADIKEYLQEAAYRESSPQKTVSLTEYLCDIVRADRQKRNAKDFKAALEKKQKRK